MHSAHNQFLRTRELRRELSAPATRVYLRCTAHSSNSCLSAVCFVHSVASRWNFTAVINPFVCTLLVWDSTTKQQLPAFRRGAIANKRRFSRRLSLRSHLGSGKRAERPKRPENLFRACPSSHLFCYHRGRRCRFRPHPSSLRTFVGVVALIIALFRAVCSFIDPRTVIKSDHFTQLRVSSATFGKFLVGVP